MNILIEGPAVQNNETFYGEVCWFSNLKGIGFILWEKDCVKQNDMFCHYSDLEMSGFKTLKAGQKVKFKIGQNNHGRPKAIEVTVIK